MKNFEQDWAKLAAAARRAPRAPDEAAPYGFATRVAALAFEQRPPASLFGRMALRAAGVSLLLAMVAVGVNYSAIKGAFGGDPSPSASPSAASDDPVAEVVDLAT
jgi:hypothetical protein